MAAERARGCELAQLVPDHGLGDEDRHVLAAVVDSDGVADHLREDRGGARPGLDHLLLVCLVHHLDALHEALLGPGPLLSRSTHRSSPLLLASATSADDHGVGSLALLAGAVAQRRLPPRGDRVAARRLVRLAAAVRVVDRVHGDAAGLRANALVALAAGLADGEILVLGVGERADGRAAVGADQPHLAGGKAQRHHGTLLRDHLDGGPGGAAETAALTRDELDVVDHGSRGDRSQRQRVAGANVGAIARGDGCTRRHPGRGEDVALRTVGVMEQGDVARAVGVVLDARHLGVDAVLGSLEVDLAIAALGPATAMPRRDTAASVAAAALPGALGKRLVRTVGGDLVARLIRREAAPGAGRLCLAEGHYSTAAPSNSSMRSPGASSTIAFFHARVLPLCTPRRLGLERTCEVRTAATRTSKTCSTALAIWVLCARSSTRNVYLPSAISA